VAGVGEAPARKAGSGGGPVSLEKTKLFEIDSFTVATPLYFLFFLYFPCE
jgi:hypothetical protein